MDYDANLLALQGVLTSANIEFPFSDIQHRGGNENNILNIVHKVFEYLSEKTFVDTNGIVKGAENEVKKYFLFIILNTDFTALTDMVDICEIEHIIWNIQTIPKILLCDLTFGLGMDEFIEEAISQSSPKLALELFKLLTSYLKYLKLDSYHKPIKSILIGGYNLICKLICYDSEKLNINAIACEAFETFHQCLNYFLDPPNVSKLEELKGYQLYSYQGKTLKTIIETTNMCLNVFKSEQNLVKNDDALFTLTITQDIINCIARKGIFCEISDGVILEIVEKCNEAVLDKVSNLLTLVDVNVFCCWSEIEEDDGKTLQVVLRQLSHKLLLQARSVEKLSQHMVLDMLSCMFGEPKTIIEQIKLADDSTLLENASKTDENCKAWFLAILQRDHFLQTPCLITFVADNLSKHVEFAEVVFEKCSAMILSDISISDDVKLLAIRAFSLLDSTQQLYQLNKTFSNQRFHNKFEIPSFEDKCTEIFNKLVTTDMKNLNDINFLLLGNPKTTFAKIVDVGCENKHQARQMGDVLEYLSKFSLHKYETDQEPVLQEIIKQKIKSKIASECLKDSLEILFKRLKEGLIIDINEILKCIMVNMLPAMKSRDFLTLNCYVNLLSYYDPSQLSTLRPPVLVMLGQLMDVARWGVNNYSADAVTLLEDTISVQQKLIKSYSGGISDKDRDWLKSKLASLNPSNMYYFRLVWNKSSDDYFGIVTDSADVSTSTGFLLLVKLLISSTPREWCETYDSISASGKSDTLLTFRRAVKTCHSIANEAVAPNLADYVFSNFAVLLKQHFARNDSEETARQALKMISNIVNEISDEKTLESLNNTFLPLISFLSEKKPNAFTQFDFNKEFVNEKFRENVQDVVKNAQLNGGGCYSVVLFVVSLLPGSLEPFHSIRFFASIN